MNEADYLDRLRSKIRLSPVRQEVTNADIELLLLRAKNRDSDEWSEGDQAEQEGIDERLARLTPGQMEVIKLRYFGDGVMSFREIAKRLGVSIMSVWRLHYRAMRKMKE